MSDMKERAAKAAYTAMAKLMAEKFKLPPELQDHQMNAWENQSAELQEDWRAAARAAIREMRSPTGRMIVAGYNQFDPDDQSSESQRRSNNRRNCQYIYEAMIDEALK